MDKGFFYSLVDLDINEQFIAKKEKINIDKIDQIKTKSIKLAWIESIQESRSSLNINILIPDQQIEIEVDFFVDETCNTETKTVIIQITNVEVEYERNHEICGSLSIHPSKLKIRSDGSIEAIAVC